MKRLHVREDSLYYTLEDFWNNYFKSAGDHWAPEKSRWNQGADNYYLRASDKFCFLYFEEPSEILVVQTDVSVTEIHNREIKVIKADNRTLWIYLKTGAHIRIDL